MGKKDKGHLEDHETVGTGDRSDPPQAEPARKGKGKKKKDRSRKQKIDKVLVGTPADSSREKPPKKGGGKRGDGDDGEGTGKTPKKAKRPKGDRKGRSAPVKSVNFVLLGAGEAARATFDPSSGCLELAIPLSIKVEEPQGSPDPEGGPGI